MAPFEGLSFDSSECPNGNPLVQILKATRGFGGFSARADEARENQAGSTSNAEEMLETSMTEKGLDDAKEKPCRASAQDCQQTGGANLDAMTRSLLQAIRFAPQSHIPAASRMQDVYANRNLSRYQSLNRASNPDWDELFRRAAAVSSQELAAISESNANIDVDRVRQLEDDLDTFTGRFGELLGKKMEGVQIDEKNVEEAAVELEIELDGRWRGKAFGDQNEYDLALDKFIEKMEFEQASDGESGALLDEEYNFYPNNPYLERDINFLEDTSAHRNLVESILCLEAALQRFPTRGDLWHKLGVLHQTNEADLLAIPALSNAAKYANTPADALHLLAVSYTNELCHDKALDTELRWMQLNKNLSGKLPPGSTLGQIKSILSAEIRNTPATAENASYLSDLYSLLGISMINSNDFHLAAALFTSALVHSPKINADDITNRIGAAYISCKDLTKAFDIYSKLLEHTPRYPRAMYNLAMAHAANNDHRNAILSLLEASNLQGDMAAQLDLQSYLPNTEKYFSDEAELRRFRRSHKNQIWDTAENFIRGNIPANLEIERALSAKDISVLSKIVDRHFSVPGAPPPSGPVGAGSTDVERPNP